MGVHDLWLFFAALILLCITPGPDMALIVARSASGGVRAGGAAALGVGAGIFVHITAAALGISALIMASATAFEIVRIVGGIYLVYMGARMIWGTFNGIKAAELPVKESRMTLRATFGQGFLTNVLNPKVALFFLAFLPQFIDADAPSRVLAFFTLGIIVVITGTAWNLVIAWAGGKAGSHFNGRRLWLDRVIGGLFVGLGMKLVLARQP